MGSWKSREARKRCDCRTTGRPGCCNGGNRLSHPTEKVTSTYIRSRSLPQTPARNRTWKRSFERALDADVRDGKLSRQSADAAKKLLTYSNSRGKPVWPLQVTVAVLMDVSDRSVCRYLAELRTNGWLAVRHRCRPTANGMRGRSNEYLLVIPGELDAPQRSSTQTRRASHAVAPTVTTSNDPPPADEVDPQRQANVELWMAALRTKDEAEIRNLASNNLDFVPLPGRTLAVGTLRALAYRLADRAPP